MTAVPLKRLADIRVSNVDKKAVDGEQPVRLCNYTDVYYRDAIEPDQEFMSATASPEQAAAFRLRSDDVIITKDSETAEDIGVPAYVRATAPDLVCGYHLAIIRPDQRQLDGRFLYWFMSSTVARDQLAIAATGVTRFGLRTESTGAVRVPLIPVSHQRRLAGHLDTETARIDALIEKKKQLSELLTLRTRSMTEGLLRTHCPDVVPLRRVVTKVGSGSTPRGGAESYVPHGIAFLRSQNIRNGRIRREDIVFIDPSVDETMKGTRVREGDVLLNITGASIGRTAVAGATDLPANVSQHVCIVRPAPGVDPTLLQVALESQEVVEQIRQLQVGGNREGLNFDQVRSLAVRVPDGAAPELRGEIERARLATATARSLLTRQVALLQEHRQALITAAVTGELEIPGVA